MGFIHFADCPVWLRLGSCTCPREWRIRKRRCSLVSGSQRYPWVVSRRDDNGVYRPLIYAARFEVALEAVLGIMQIIRITDTKHRRQAVSGDQVG